MEVKEGCKKVFLPIQIPKGNYCDDNKIHCQYLRTTLWGECGALDCDLRLGKLSYGSIEDCMKIGKPKACLKLQTDKKIPY